MAEWIACPAAGRFRHTRDTLAAQWTRLHAGDAEALPADDALWDAWLRFHNGDFAGAVQSGRAAGPAGQTVVFKAISLYANYLEPLESQRLALFRQVADQASATTAEDASHVGAWYWQGYALGRYSQGISVARALAQGLGARVKAALEKTIALQPHHADAHFALGAFHAEVIDKVGALIGSMTYGVRKDTGLAFFQRGLTLDPGSLVGRVEYASALLMLEGESRDAEARHLCEQAAATEPVDALEWLQAASARQALED